MAILSPLTKSLTRGVTQDLFGSLSSPSSPFVNTKGVLFDGTDDNLTSSADSTLATKTYSFWAKSDDTTSNAKNGVFDHGANIIGAFVFNTAAVVL